MGEIEKQKKLTRAEPPFDKLRTGRERREIFDKNTLFFIVLD
jgi:hypothetical protein